MTQRTAYRAAFAVAIGGGLVLLWLMGAVGVIGIEGDPADRMYFGVLGLGVVGALIARFRAPGMALTLLVMAGAVGLVAVIALFLGKHQAEYSSVFEILGLNAFFVVVFAASAWLFQQAAGERRPPGGASAAGGGSPTRA